ncbi:tyrosine-type recombinase/integrase [Sulfurovum sp. CS9]|uniref:tyrosine-type recombinase/integrase n=1 Tax=Sulfurovum sp. CS9 TaxID=3391146 RepID=UPI0039EA456F
MSKYKSIGGKYKGIEIYKKLSGAISYYIRYKDLENKTKREKVGESPTMTKTKALEILRQKQSELNTLRRHLHSGDINNYLLERSRASDSLRLTINDLAVMYLKDKANTKDFPSTKSRYHIHIESEKISNKPIMLITNEDIKKFIQNKKDTYSVRNGMQRKRDRKGKWLETKSEYESRQNKLTNTTINAIYGLMITIVNHGTQEEYYIGRNPFHSKFRLPTDNIKLKYLSDEETSLFLRQLKWQSESFEIIDKYVYLIGLLAVTTGARMRTILYLRAGDVDLDNGVIHLCNFKVNEQWYESAIATDEIRELLQKFSKGRGPNDHLFVSNRTGKQIYRYPRVMNKILELTVNWHRQEENRMTLRDLRNSLASNLARKGISLSHIAKVLNHKSIASTARYAQLGSEVAIEAIRDYAKRLNV